MRTNKYTLYFVGENKYFHKQYLPVLTADLKVIDEYIGNYNNYVELYNCLPNDIKHFIEEKINYNINLKSIRSLDKVFKISKDKCKTNLPPIFIKELDTIYITPDELVQQVQKLRLTKKEFQSILLKTIKKKESKVRYNFFEYLYNTYVKHKSIIGMIDTYELEETYSKLKGDKLYIGTIATDKSNILVLLKKIGQTSEGKRDIAIKLKKLMSDELMISTRKIISRRNKELDSKKIIVQMTNNLNEFSDSYEMEYEDY